MSDTSFTFDFQDAPPVSGSGRPDHIPPGTYLIRLEKGEKVVARSGRDMARCALRVDQGNYAGKRLSEQFVFPRNADDSRFGLQRFHGFLVALGMKQQTKRVTIELTKFIGKTCIAEVDDEEVPAVMDDDGVTVKYSAYIRSTVLGYHKVGAEDAPVVTHGEPAGSVPAQPTAPAPASAAPAAAEPVVAEAETEPEPAAADPDPDAVATDDLDDLFGE